VRKRTVLEPGAGVEPPVGAGALNMPIPDQVRTIVAAAGVADVDVGEGGEGAPGLQRQDARELPSAEKGARENARRVKTPAPAERQIVDVAEDVAMVDVEIREPAFGAEVARILGVAARIRTRRDPLVIVDRPRPGIGRNEAQA